MLSPEGFLTQHMAAHIIAMNLAAPLCAAALLRARSSPRFIHLGMATALQIILLWGWHSPAVFAASVGNSVLMPAMHLSLFTAATWFWMAVILYARRASWMPLAALLLTGKLFCLLGVLLTFAPRAIYWQAAFLPTCLGVVSPWPLLEDQQLAGLLMLTACPLVYVGAAIVIAKRWLTAMNRNASWSFAGGAR
jgi:putative membrane protein